ncbi:hypothetical protein HYFRA_00005611 [Hymenoscyphus fraxineus]|uniref:FAD dependent oxidoreductase domain-containing protein n=1 Tax=Hymenoscyphus fraxineus TaxID=746836 RepID=A0A9N9KUL5_9HELO|nr:hypothetical protein HYFRA_00005611 [Hymenoscyphus fraxineus]
MTSPHNTSYLIVGGGVFGASTAYHLSRTHPDSSIILVDRSTSYPCSLAASYDFNKIIRADYGNPFYCELALKAREAWKSEQLYKPFYHESGMVNIDDTGLGHRILKNYEILGVDPGASILTPDELKAKYDGLFAGTNYRGVEEIYLNPSSGWAEATLALRAVLEASIANGVEYRQGDIKSLTFDESGYCSGVTFQDGNSLKADNIILCTGAGTAKLLARSAPDREDLHAGNRITAAAVVTGIVKLTSAQRERFSKSPVFVHAIDGVLGEVLPPTPEGLLKFCVDVSFKNTSLDSSSGQEISAPPESSHQDQHDVPESLKRECYRVVRGIFGDELAGSQFDSFRICWDGITPNQDFIISKHPYCQNLCIATGGSFHGWKFLPIIGKYVVEMLDGQLDESHSARFAWNRDQSGSAHEKIVPQRELRDLL